MEAPEAFGWPIWLYFFIGGVAGGAVAAASVANLVRRGREPALGWWSVVIGLPLVALSLILLLFDLGRPERFTNLLTSWQPTSPLWWGTWILGATVAAYGLLLLAYRRGRLTPPLRAMERTLLWANLVASGLLVTYTGVLLANTSRPLWSSTALIPVLFALSATSTGIAALGIAARRERRDTLKELERADNAIIVLEAVALAAFVAWLGLFAGAAGTRALQALVFGGGAAAPAFWLAVATGVAAPLFIAATRDRVVAWARPALVLIGGLLLRIAIVVGGQASPIA